MKENFIEIITQTHNHPFQKILQIKNNTTITSKISQTDKVIYSEKQTNEEELIREIAINAFDRINTFKKHFVIEDKIKNGRADLVSKDLTYKILHQVVEFKKVSNTQKISEQVENAFSQVKTYIQDYITEELTETKECFGTVFFMDLEKIVKEPSLIDKYNNEINIKIKSNKKESLETYGVYIESKIFRKEQGFEEKSHHEIPVTEQFLKNTNPNELYPELGFTRKAVDAFFTITSTPSMGVSNVRERLTFDSKAKKDLLFEMLSTLITAFNKKDKRCLNRHSETKMFVYFAPSSIVTDIKVNLEHPNVYFITTTNGALINGQQSTQIPYEIIRISKTNLEELDFNERKIKDKLYKELEKEFSSQQKIDEFISFVKNCSFNYQIEKSFDEDEIKEIAINRNRSISIDKVDAIFASPKSARFKFLSLHIYQKYELLYNYPNISKRFSKTTESKTPIIFIPKIYEFFYSKKEKSEISLFKKAYSFNPENEFKKDQEKGINSIVEIITDNRIETKEKNEKSILEEKLKTFKELLNEGILDEEAYFNKVSITKEEIETLKEKIKNKEEAHAVNYSIKKEVDKNLEKILRIHEAIHKKVNLLTEEDLGIIKLNKDKIVYLVMGVLKYNYCQENSCNLKLDVIEKHIDTIIKRFIKVRTTEEFHWISDLGNNKKISELSQEAKDIIHKLVVMK